MDVNIQVFLMVGCKLLSRDDSLNQPRENKADLTARLGLST